MNEKTTIIEKIYDAPSEELPALAEKSIKEACELLEKYANKTVKKADIMSHRWVLLNLLNVLYKDVFLLQTEDLNHIIESKPKELDENLSERCYKCNSKLSRPAHLRKVEEHEKIKGLCLNCFISTVKKGNWWNESWTRLKEKL